MSQGVSETSYRDINTIDEAGSDYVVVQRGGSYLARATYTAPSVSHTFSDTDLLTVLEDAYAELPAGYLGKIILKLRGAHPLSDTLLLDKPQFELQGLGWGTELASDIALPQINVQASNVFLKDMVLSNPNAGASENLRVGGVINFKAYNVWGYGASSGLRVLGNIAQPTHADFIECKWSDGGEGIEIENWIDYVRITNNLVVANSVRGFRADTTLGGIIECVGLNMQNPAVPVGLRLVNCANNRIKFIGGGIYGGETVGADIGTNTALISMESYDIIQSLNQGLIVANTDRFSARGLNVINCRTAGALEAVRIDASVRCRIEGQIFGTNHNPDILEAGAADYNWFDVEAALITLVGGSSRLKRKTPNQSWNSGQAVIANGTTTIAVPHGLGVIPRVVIVNGSTLDTRDAFAELVGAVTFNASVNAPVGANRTVWWFAEI